MLITTIVYIINWVIYLNYTNIFIYIYIYIYIYSKYIFSPLPLICKNTNYDINMYNNIVLYVK